MGAFSDDLRSDAMKGSRLWKAADHIEALEAQIAALTAVSEWPVGAMFSIAHDGFKGVVIGHYVRLDGKRGVVGQQTGTNIVHVYGEKWLAR